MKKIYIILLLTINIGLNIYAEPPVIELETESLSSMNVYSFDNYWFENHYVYLSGSGGSRFKNVQTFEEGFFDSTKEIKTILGTYGDNFLVSRNKQDQSNKYLDENGFIDIYIYNPREDSYKQLDKIVGGTAKSDIKYLFHYHDEYLLCTRSTDGTYDYGRQVLINYETGEEMFLPPGGLMVDLSPDKLTGLYYRRNEREYQIKKIGERGSVLGTYNNLISDDRNSFFITNDLFALQFNEDLRIFNMNCQLQVTFKYLIPKGTNLNPIHFKKFRNSQYGYFGPDYTLVKAPDIYPYLDELGLLFHPTTATLNDDRVRMREWPLLDAQHVAFLKQDEEVEVLDRSGIKVQIDDMNDYWYKVKRSDGTEGWTYGYFLDLAEEE